MGLHRKIFLPFLHLSVNLPIIFLLLVNTPAVTDMKQKTHVNVTKWKQELLRLYNLTQQLDRFIANVTEERDQLQQEIYDLRLRICFNNKNCPREWQRFGLSLYYLSSKKKSWEKSRLDCLHRGADLVVINSRDEQEFLSLFRDRYWIGLTDRETEGTWKWVDDTPLNITHWGRGEPNNYMGLKEDCAEVRYQAMENSWNDEMCVINKYWICEKAAPPDIL